MYNKKVLVTSLVEGSFDYCKFLVNDVGYCLDNNCLALLSTFNIDLVILDCAVESDDSIDLLKKIKQMHPGIPVIVVAGFGSEDFFVKAFRSGARDIFKKPVNGIELRKTVDSILWLRQESQEHRNALSSISFEVTQEKHRFSDDIPESIVRAIVYIENHFLTPLNLDKIAGEAYMSKFHFCRIFKKHVGFTPIQYAINMRLKKAMNLLQRNGMSISTVGIKTGFNDQSQFNKQFKKLYGLSPSAFRKSITVR